MNYVLENMCFHLRKHLKYPCDKYMMKMAIIFTSVTSERKECIYLLIYCCYKPLWWLTHDWPKRVGEYMEHIYKCAFFVCHVVIKYSFEHLMLFHTNVTWLTVWWAILSKSKVTSPCVKNIYLSSRAIWTYEYLKCVYPNYMRTGRSTESTSVMPVTVQVTSASLNIPFIWSAGPPHKFLCRFVFIYM
jgi:hypothetical protein